MPAEALCGARFSCTAGGDFSDVRWGLGVKLVRDGNLRGDSPGEFRVLRVGQPVSLCVTQLASALWALFGGESNTHLTVLDRVWGLARPLPGVAVELCLAAPDGFGEAGGCRGQAKAQWTCGWGAFSSPAGSHPSQPQSPPLEAPVHETRRTPSNTHSRWCHRRGGHIVITQRCARLLWLLTGAQRLLLLGLGRQPWVREAGKECPASSGCLYLAAAGARQANPRHNSGLLT